MPTVEERLAALPAEEVTGVLRGQVREQLERQRELLGQAQEANQAYLRLLGELDFAGLCRTYGIPEPTRQVVRFGPKGRVYLDAAWEDIGWAVEIDGAHHFWGLTPTDDSFRQNEIMLSDEKLLRMTLVGLRLEETRFMDQVARAHARAGRRAA